MGISCFVQVSQELESHGQVEALDLPGFGDAPVPLDALSMAQMGALLIDFLELGGLGRPGLVGHSMGTQVRAEAAAQRPGLFPELVLVAPSVNRTERTIGWQTWRVVQDLLGESPDVVAIGMRTYAKTGPRWFIKKLRSTMDRSVEETLPKILAHTLVIRGNRDRICPRSRVEEVTSLIPGATMAEADGRGHETRVELPVSGG